jgi:hypothetical protein
MDKDMHQGHEPEYVDLTQIEAEPSARADPLFERQTDLTGLAAPWFGARFYSDTPVGSPAGTATTLLKVVVAAGLPAAGLAAGGWALGVAGWLTLTLALLIFLVIWAVGLFLILRIQPSLPAPRETNSDHNDGKNEGEDDGTDLRTDCDKTYQRHRRDPLQQPEPTRAPRALQPPRRR